MTPDAGYLLYSFILAPPRGLTFAIVWAENVMVCLFAPPFYSYVIWEAPVTLGLCECCEYRDYWEFGTLRADYLSLVMVWLPLLLLSLTVCIQWKCYSVYITTELLCALDFLSCLWFGTSASDSYVWVKYWPIRFLGLLHPRKRTSLESWDCLDVVWVDVPWIWIMEHFYDVVRWDGVAVTKWQLACWQDWICLCLAWNFYCYVDEVVGMICCHSLSVVIHKKNQCCVYQLQDFSIS